MEIGKDVATSPGTVVLRTRLFELVHYPHAGTQIGAPVLVVFSPLSKFYILDLHDDYSFVRDTTRAGFPVFIMSWRMPGVANPPEDLAAYVKAVATAQAITGRCHLFGYCFGGAIARLAVALDASPYLTLTTAASSMRLAHPETRLGVLKDVVRFGVSGGFISVDKVVEWLSPLVSHKVRDARLSFWAADLCNMSAGLVHGIYSAGFDDCFSRGIYSMNGRVLSPLPAIPTTTLAGRYDKLVTLTDVLASHPPGHSLVVIEAGHFVIGCDRGFSVGGTTYPGRWEPVWYGWLQRHGPARERERTLPNLGPAPGKYVHEVAKETIENVVRGYHMGSTVAGILRTFDFGA